MGDTILFLVSEREKLFYFKYGRLSIERKKIENEVDICNVL